MIRATLSRLYASAALAVASFFDRGLDRIIGEFTALDYDLERYIEKQQAIVARTATVVGASFDRQREVLNAESKLRETAYDREDAAAAGAARARRVRERIAKLLD